MRTTPNEYYERHQFLYNWFWSRSALHYGFWTKETRTLSDAIEHANHVISTYLSITATDHVLDLGSGTGGTSVSLACETGCRVTGITISPRQQRQSTQHAVDNGVADRVTFVVDDFEKPLPFLDGAFTAVVAIEGFCYAHDKQKMLFELFRALAPGGRIAIADGFLTRETMSLMEQKCYDICRKGWQVPSLTTVACMYDMLQRAGFDDLTWNDYTPEVIRSSERIRWLGYLTVIPAWLLTVFRILPLYDNSRSMIEQRKMFDGVAQYGIVTAKKA